MNFVTELKRRNVFRVGAAYAVIAWFIVQAADIMLDNFGSPGWVFKTVVGLLALGFPLALFLSWAYELTPDGVEKAADLEPDGAAAPSTPRRRSGSFTWILLLTATAAAGLTWLEQSNPELPGQQARVSADVQAGSKSPTGADQMRRLWVRALDQPDRRELTGTDGAMFPFWSPDSRELAFFDGRLLRRYDLASDTIITMVAVGSARGGAWTEDGRIIYTNDFRSGLSIVDANGGEPTPLTTLDEDLHTSHRWPFVIAGTNQYLFTAITDDHPSDWTADGRFLIVTTDAILPSDRNDIIAVPLDGGPEISLITEPGPQFNGRVSPDGRWLAYQGTSGISRIYVIPFAPTWPERQRQRKWLVADNGGHRPRWSLEGDELFFVTETGSLIAVDIEATADEFSFSVPRYCSRHRGGWAVRATRHRTRQRIRIHSSSSTATRARKRPSR